MWSGTVFKEHWEQFPLSSSHCTGLEGVPSLWLLTEARKRRGTVGCRGAHCRKRGPRSVHPVPEGCHRLFCPWLSQNGSRATLGFCLVRTCHALLITVRSQDDAGKHFIPKSMPGCLLGLSHNVQELLYLVSCSFSFF